MFDVVRALRGAALPARAALAFVLVACTARVPEGSNCQFNDDCVEPLVCAGRFCRAACVSDRDCPPAWRCRVAETRARNVCLPPPAAVLCVATSDCPAAAACAQGNVCRWQCASDGDCSGRAADSRCQGGLCSTPVLVSELPTVVDAAAPDAAADVAADVTPDAAPDAMADDAPETSPDAAPDVAGDAQPDASPDVVDAATDAPRDAAPCEPGGLTTCALPSATAACRGGACVVERCATGRGDCDGDARSGCEVDLAEAPAHCGACGVACPAEPNTRGPACRDARCAVGPCLDGFADCDPAPGTGCETQTARDARNCGGCGVVCATRPNAAAACAEGRCGVMCSAGFGDCNGDASDGCEASVTTEAHCGACGRSCPAAEVCQAGVCTPAAFPSNGSEGAFDPMPATTDAGAPARTVVVLDAGVHHFTTVRIRPSVVVQVQGDGVLDLRAAGPVLVEGTIDLAGGAGRAIDGSPAQDDNPGGGTGGGATGTATAGEQGTAAACGAPGGGGRGVPGGSAASSAPNCGAGGAVGGGAGGATGRGGGGGGGYAGGGGGAGGDTTSAAPGGAGASAMGEVGGFGGTVASRHGGGGAASLGAPYAGGSGTAVSAASFRCGGGGGGSVGAAAAGDLRVTEATFRPGSAGGGGGGNFNACGGLCRPQQGMGGGGGGGALRIASSRSITLAPASVVRVTGGAGGTTTAAIGGCPGGSGSGGVVYLSAPEVRCDRCVLHAAGGPAVSSGYAGANGGAGGMGRIRMSVVPSRCAIGATTAPPMPAGGCAASTAARSGEVYIGAYPD